MERAEPATLCGADGDSRAGPLKIPGCVGEFAATDVTSVIKALRQHYYESSSWVHVIFIKRGVLLRVLHVA